MVSTGELGALTLHVQLDSAEPLALDEVGHALGVTRERARQIEAGARRKMRQPTIVAALRDGQPHVPMPPAHVRAIRPHAQPHHQLRA